MEVVCNANLPRPERLVSLQAEKTVGKIFTERPSGSGAAAAAVVPPAGRPAARVGLPNRPGGGFGKFYLVATSTEAEGGRKALTSAVDDQQVTRRGLFGAFVVALEPGREQRKRCERRRAKGTRSGTARPEGRGSEQGASLHTGDAIFPPGKVTQCDIWVAHSL